MTLAYIAMMLLEVIMAATMKSTTVRFDEATKNQAIEILDSIGLSFNAYLNLAVKQLVNQRCVPFRLEAASYEPNEQTQKALREADLKERGLIPDDSPSFATANDAMAFLEG